MTYAPARLLELRAYLVPRTGITDLRLLGITPDPAHNGGYHCGWDQRRIVSGQLDDYSWEESARDSSHRTNAARAIDIGAFGRLRELSIWLAGQCAGGAPDTADIREVIYSPDGRTVKRWDRLGRRTSGDSSHLTHTHISYFADAEARDKTAVFRRFFDVEVDMFTAQIQGNPVVWVSDGIRCRPVADYPTLLRYQRLGARHEVVPNADDLKYLIGDREFDGPDPVTLTPEQLAVLEAAAERGAEAGVTKSADELAVAVAERVDVDVDELKAAMREVLGSAHIVVPAE